MKAWRFRGLAAVLGFLASWAILAGVSNVAVAEPANPLGRTAPGFQLRDFRGKEHALADLAEKKIVVVAFLGTECPLAKLYGPRLNELAARFAAQGVAFVGIDANQQDSVTELANYARVHELTFPLLKDVGNSYADALGAMRTPEAFVLDAERKIRYWGRIDDQYGVGTLRPKPTREDVAVAIEELLAGKAVSVPTTVAPGCRIGRVHRAEVASDVTYSRDVSRIFQKRCVECHREGQIAPFPLTAYEDAAGWAETILEVVDAGRMPPWHADPKHGDFINDARLSDEEKSVLHRWVKAGAPEGNKSDLPEPIKYAEGWRIPAPDQVVFMSDKPYKVPAEEEVRYQYYMVDPGFTEDKWIKAAECLPGNRAVVHHIIVGIQPPGGRGAGKSSVDSDWLVATAPGARPMLCEPGYAKRVPKGSKLVFQVHYTPNGSPQSDRSCVGLVFADPKTVHKEIGTWKASTQRFSIPPGENNHRVEASYTFSRDSLLLAMFPHMHLRGKAFKYEAIYKDGRTEVLLDVPRYDFGWQNAYVLREPKVMPAGTKMHCVAHFDNSDENLSNPNPKATVRWGDQTWEEMMIGYFDMALVDQDLQKPNQTEESRTDKFNQAAAAAPPAIDEEIKTLAAGALQDEDSFNKFGEALQAKVPQLDRVDWVLVADGRLNIQFAAQEDSLRQRGGGAGTKFPSFGMGLAKIAEGEKVVVYQDTSEAKQPDFQLLSRVFGASLHVPVKLKGEPGTINFWSKESDAFPPAAEKFLTEAARLVKTPDPN